MNRRGFTLAELLGVIIIIGILGSVALISVDKNIKQGAYKTCKMQERIIIEGAKAWAIDNTPSATTSIKVQNLKTGGYIDNDLVSPLTNENYSSNTKVIITVNGNKYSYEVSYGIAKENCENQKV